MSQQKGTVLNCFSPPVMLATLTIEFCLAAYTIWRYKLDTTGRLITALLINLAIFQLAEYFVCTGIGSMALPWSRVGFVAITILPPLGLHLMHVLAAKPNRKLVQAAYASMLGFIAYFILAPGIFLAHQCTGNYVIFQFSPRVSGAYSFYYFGWIITGIYLGFRWADKIKAKVKRPAKQLETVQGLILGYMVFLIPSAISMAVNTEVRRGIPSVLCGFAVSLALILTLYILPRAGVRKTKA